MIEVLKDFFYKFLTELCDSEGLVRKDNLVTEAGPDQGTVYSGIVLLDEDTGVNKFDLAKVIMDSFVHDCIENTGYSIHCMPEITNDQDDGTFYYDCYVKTPENTYKLTVDYTVAFPYLIIRILF